MKKRLQKLTLLTLLTLLSVSAWAQTNLKGTVKEGSEGLPGVSVVVVGTTKGTLSNADGTYSLALTKGTYQISFSFIGYAAQTQSVTIGDSDVTLDVNLSSSDNVLDAVVISTGSRNTQRTILDSPLPIDIIGAKDLASTGQTSFDKALQYRVP